MNWKHPKKNVEYVVISELHHELINWFNMYLKGKKKPFIVNNKTNSIIDCAFYSDFIDFKSNYMGFFSEAHFEIKR